LVAREILRGCVKRGRFDEAFRLGLAGKKRLNFFSQRLVVAGSVELGCPFFGLALECAVVQPFNFLPAPVFHVISPYLISGEAHNNRRLPGWELPVVVEGNYTLLPFGNGHPVSVSGGICSTRSWLK